MTLDPYIGELVGFYHPRRQAWETHFRLDDGEIAGLTLAGRATVFTFRLSDAVRVAQRRALVRQGRY